MKRFDTDSVVVDDKKIGKRLREIREKHGCLQSTLAGILGCSASTVCRIEQGRTQLSADQLQSCAKYFQESIDDLLGRKKKQELKRENKLRDLALKMDHTEFEQIARFSPYFKPGSQEKYSLMDLGERLRWLRKKAGYSQGQMAERLGYSPKSKSTIHYIEQNERELTIDLLLRYADVFSVSLDYLFHGVDTDIPRSFRKILLGLSYDEQNKILEMAGRFHIKS